MSAEQLVRNCAPTLAGIKTGSLYTLHLDEGEDLRSDLAYLNRSLNRKGLRIIPLKISDTYALIYIYRPSLLEEDLKDPIAKKIMGELGYTFKSADRCVAELIRRLKTSSEFPHEIGLFLGYPPSDVLGFMRDPNKGVEEVGYWKVYSNVENAREAFRRYRMCTREYNRMYRSGRTLEQLIV